MNRDDIPIHKRHIYDTAMKLPVGTGIVSLVEKIKEVAITAEFTAFLIDEDTPLGGMLNDLARVMLAMTNNQIAPMAEELTKIGAEVTFEEYNGR